VLDDSWLELSCRIAHVRALPVGSRIGLTAQFADFADRKGYLQLLLPVSIGSAFRAASPEETLQTEPDFHKVIFTGRPGTELNVWYEGTARGPLFSFVCQIDDYVVQGAKGQAELQIFSRQTGLPDASRKRGSGAGKLPKPVRDEIHRLFRWTVLNLSPEVPPEVRTFLQDFAT